MTETENRSRLPSAGKPRFGRAARWRPKQGRGHSPQLNVLGNVAERRRLEAELKERVHLAQFQATIGAALNSHENLQTALQACAQALVETFDAAFGRIWTLNEAENVLELQASAGLYTHLNGAHGRVPVGQFKVGLIAQERTPHLTNQVIGDPRVADQAWAEREGMVAFAGYPLLVEEKMVGVMAVFARHPLAVRDLEAMATVANHVALAVQRKQTEIALRQSESRFRQVWENTSDAMAISDADGIVLEANPAYLQLYGFTRQQVIGHNFTIIFPEERRAASIARYQKIFANPQSYPPIESTIRRGDGRTRTVESRVTFLTMTGLQPAMLSTIRDITERKEFELRLQIIHQLVEAVNRVEAVEQIYELALDGLERILHVDRASILLTDLSGIMRFQAWRSLSPDYRLHADGHSPWTTDEVNPQPVLVANVAEADFGELQAIIVGEGISALGFVPLIEQGQLLGKLMLYYNQPHHFTDEEIQWAQTIARHVAHALQRKQAEARLKNYAQTLEALNRVQMALAAELDLDKLLQLVTDEATQLSGAQFGAFFHNIVNKSGESYMLYTLSGVPREAFAGFPMPRATHVFGPTFRGEGIVRLADVTQDPRYGNNPPYSGLPPGHLPIRSYLAVPVLARTNEVIGGLFFGHSEPNVFTEDAEQIVAGIATQAAVAINSAQLVAQIKENEAALRELNATLEQRVEARTADLEQSNRDLDQFAYVASHDLKAPLRGIHQLASWISDDAAAMLPPTSQDHLTKLQGRVRRMETLLDDLLAYSRAGRLRHQPEVQNTFHLAHNVAEMLAPPAGFQIDIAPELPTMIVERTPLELVFRNLIGNGIKHHEHPSQGRITVTANDVGDFVEFVVQDNGPGIDPIFHTRIFGMFQTLKPRAVVEASGMGLALVQKLIESRGGTIRVESSLGAGATFRFTWPKNPEIPA